MWSSSQGEGDRYRASQYEERPVKARTGWEPVQYENVRPRADDYPERPRKVETANHTATQAKSTILVGRTRGTGKSSGASIPKSRVEDRGEVKMRNINLRVTEGIGSDLQPRSMSWQRDFLVP
jgi:hypothetical protein